MALEPKGNGKDIMHIRMYRKEMYTGVPADTLSSALQSPPSLWLLRVHEVVLDALSQIAYRATSCSSGHSSSYVSGSGNEFSIAVAQQPSRLLPLVAPDLPRT